MHPETIHTKLRRYLIHRLHITDLNDTAVIATEILNLINKQQ